MDGNDFYAYVDSKPSTQDILGKVIKFYNDFHNDGVKNHIIRAEIINVITNEVVDFAEIKK